MDSFETELRARAGRRRILRGVGLFVLGAGLGLLLIYGLRLLKEVTSDSIGGAFGGIILIAVMSWALHDPDLLAPIDVEQQLTIRAALERIGASLHHK